MDKIDQLLIRACKSKDPFTRLHSLYRRMYMKLDKEQTEEALLYLLCELCDKYAPISAYKLIHGIRACGVDAYTVPLYHIRFSRRDMFEGITWKRYHNA